MSSTHHPWVVSPGQGSRQGRASPAALGPPFLAGPGSPGPAGPRCSQPCRVRAGSRARKAFACYIILYNGLGCCTIQHFSSLYITPPSSRCNHSCTTKIDAFWPFQPKILLIQNIIKHQIPLKNVIVHKNSYGNAPTTVASKNNAANNPGPALALGPRVAIFP